MNFVRRNRIIAGLADATVVVAKRLRRGGGLITASIAQSYCRDVCAFPGRATDEFSEGCNKLIRTGRAQLVTSAAELTEALCWDKAAENKAQAAQEKELFPVLTADEQLVANTLAGSDGMQLNMLAAKTGIHVGKLMSLLFGLEMRGIVKKHERLTLSPALSSGRRHWQHTSIKIHHNMKITIPKAIKLLAACLFMLLPAACINDNEDNQSKSGTVKVGDKLPDFRVTMSTGEALRTNDLKGKPAVIVLFNTSCPDCRKELAAIQQLYESYGTSGQVTFTAISRAQSHESVSKYWTENGLTIPYSAQNDDKVYKLFAQIVIPRTYIADGRLTVQYSYNDNPLPTAEELEKNIKDVLGNAGM